MYITDIKPLAKFYPNEHKENVNSTVDSLPLMCSILILR